MGKVKVAAYCRVSTSSSDQKNSFENQKDYFENVANDSDIYDIVEIYADEGISAMSVKKRGQFLRMIHDAGVDVRVDGTQFSYHTDNKRKPKFEKILIKDISRFSRNLDTIPLFRALRAKGVSIVGTNIGMEFATDDDEFQLSMLITFAQHESVDKAKKVRYGIKQMAEKGSLKMTRDLFGYHWNQETKEIDIVEHEAEIVREIFDLYVNKNIGVRRIVNILSEKGVRTRRGKKFWESSINRMIDNRKYIGDLILLKYDSGTVLNKFNSNKVKPEDEWIVHEGVIKPIVSKEIFEKAQELKQKRKFEKNVVKVYTPMTEYAKMIYCTNCGAVYGRNRANGKYFMNCSSKKRFGRKVCDYPNFMEEDLNAIIKKLGEEGLPKHIRYNKNSKIETLENLKAQLIAKKDEDIPAEYFIKKDELDVLNDKKNKLVDLYLEGNFDKSMLDEKVNVINSQLDEIKSVLNQLNKPMDELDKQVRGIDEQIDQISALKIKKAFTKEETLDLIDKIEVEHVFNHIKLTIRLKLYKAIEQAAQILNVSNDEYFTFTYTLPTGKGVPPRIPPMEQLYVLREDVDPEEARKDMDEHMKARQEEYDRLSKN